MKSTFYVITCINLYPSFLKKRKNSQIHGIKYQRVVGLFERLFNKIYDTTSIFLLFSLFFFPRIIIGSTCFSTTSLVMITFSIFSFEGTSNIISSIIFSMIPRRPLAPVFVSMAFCNCHECILLKFQFDPFNPKHFYVLFH